MKLLSSLETLEELIDEAKTAPFSQKILVDPEEIGQLIEQIKKQVPEEIKDATWIKEESERLIKVGSKNWPKRTVCPPDRQHGTTPAFWNTRLGSWISVRETLRRCGWRSAII